MKTIFGYRSAVLSIWICVFAPLVGAVDFAEVGAALIEGGDRSVAEYRQDEAVKTGNEFSRLYFDVFEGSGMEFRLGLQDSAAKTRIETGFGQVIQHAMRGAAKADLQQAWSSLRSELQTVADENKDSVQSAFSGAFLILFREGVEALLIVAALVTYLRRSGAADMQYVIWLGVVLAVLASALTAWAFRHLIVVSGAGRELVEGVTMLLAATVLLYLSYWLFAKREAERWQSFIRGRFDQALSTGSLLALGGAAFLAVFREGAETVLFYQALLADRVGQEGEVLAGSAAAVAALTAVFFCYRFASIKLPLKPFFSLTAVLMFVLAFSFIGKGLLELQILGIVASTPLPEFPHWDWLGIFPTMETLAVQGTVLLLPLVGFMVRKGMKKRIVTDLS